MFYALLNKISIHITYSSSPSPSFLLVPSLFHIISSHLIHLLSQRFTSDIYYPDVDIRASSIWCFRLSVCPTCLSICLATYKCLAAIVRPSVHLSVDDGAWFIVDLLTIFIFFLAALSTEFCISLHGYCSHGCFFLFLYVYHHSRCWFWLAMWWYVWWCWSWWYCGSYCC